MSVLRRRTPNGPRMAPHRGTTQRCTLTPSRSPRPSRRTSRAKWASLVRSPPRGAARPREVVLAVEDEAHVLHVLLERTVGGDEEVVHVWVRDVGRKAREHRIDHPACRAIEPVIDPTRIRSAKFRWRRMGRQRRCKAHHVFGGDGCIAAVNRHAGRTEVPRAPVDTLCALEPRTVSRAEVAVDSEASLDFVDDVCEALYLPRRRGLAWLLGGHCWRGGHC